MKKNIFIFLLLSFVRIWSMDDASGMAAVAQALSLKNKSEIVKLWHGREQAGLSALADAKKMSVTTHYNVKGREATLGSFNPKMMKVTTYSKDDKAYTCKFVEFEILMQLAVAKQLPKDLIQKKNDEESEGPTEKSNKKCCCVLH